MTFGINDLLGKFYHLHCTIKKERKKFSLVSLGLSLKNIFLSIQVTSSWSSSPYSKTTVDASTNDTLLRTAALLLSQCHIKDFYEAVGFQQIITLVIHPKYNCKYSTGPFNLDNMWAGKRRLMHSRKRNQKLLNRINGVAHLEEEGPSGRKDRLWNSLQTSGFNLCEAISLSMIWELR